MELLFYTLLIGIGLFSGLIGGMGGPTGFVILATLFVFTNLNNAQVAGTTSTMFTMATVAGAVLYTISGDQNWKLVATIVPSVIIGTQIGVYVNSILPEQGFELFLGILALSLGVSIIYDSQYELSTKYILDIGSIKGKSILILLGLIVGIVGGISGLGGIAILVPALIILGISPLVAVSAAITQGVATTSTTAVRYIIQGSVDFVYVALLGIPFTLAQLAGWSYAHKIDTDKLKLILGIFQIIFGLYLFSTYVQNALPL